LDGVYLHLMSPQCCSAAFIASSLCIFCKCHFKWSQDSWKNNRKWYNGAHKFCVLTFPQTC